MINIHIAVIGVILCTTPFISEVKAKEIRQVETRQNVRIVLEITEGNKPAAQFSIIGSKGTLNLNNIAGMVKIDDRELPIMMSFRTTLEPQDNTLYSLNYSYSFQLPIVTGITKDKNGNTSSKYEYKSLGTTATVNMKVGETVELLKDPNRTVILKLESAAKAAE